ncbi:MAG TPA: RNA polymerase-binding protein DksA [Burkholderiaceae bacterium]|nr:RNA polymerase-binding protein DksA [Burkholderiaceae bacterium]
MPQKLSKSSKTAAQSTAKTKASSDSKSATVNVKKVSEASKNESPKAFEKTNKVEKANTVSQQAIAPVSPAVTKAKSSRLASLTVPSMAQSVASTAAKASFGPVVNAPIVFAPAPFVAKQNPKLANNWKTKSAEELSSEEVLSMPASEYMNIKQMMFFRLRLIELKKGILESAGATSEHLRDESAVVPDPTDRATIEEEHALELRTRDRERKLLKKIEQSIARIDAGDYGYCDETGEAIGVGRLLARPTATLSLEAQQRRELKQKMYGD